MYKKIGLSILTILGLIFFSHAQVGPDITGSATNASGLVAQQRDAAIDVDLFTGIPKINIPLFEYRRGELNLNISLNYFAGGVQTEEDAPETGMGWTLGVGGVIIRTLRGIPDDFPEKGYKYTPLLNASINGSNESQYYAGSLDSQADLFTFSFNGRTGKFFIAKNGRIILIPQSKLKIEPEFVSNLNAAYTLAGFTITSEEGTKYEFKEIETTNLSYEGGTAVFINKDYPVAWYLNKIIAPFGTDTILFQYKTVTQNIRQHFPKSISISPGNTVEHLHGPSINYITNKAKKIQQIILPTDQKIRFEYMDRYDIYGDSLLKAVRIFNNNEFKHGYRFDYYYQNGDRYIANPEFQLTGSSLGYNDQTNRAFLRRIMEETSWGYMPHYEFFYNPQYFLPVKFEDDNSAVSAASRDHWGFFNGKINGTAIPSTTGFSGADREPSSTYVLAGSLSKIVFPNGGTREYQFESHDRVQVNNQSQNISFWTSAPGTKAISLSQYYSNKHKLTFVLDKTRLGSTPPFSGTCIYTFNIKNANGQVVSSLPINLTYLFYTGSTTWELTLPNGAYTLEATKPASCTLGTDCIIDVNWNNSVVASAKVIGGGIRIRKLITYTGNNNAPPLVTEYKYTMQDGVTSSGYMAQIPRYDYIYKKYSSDTYLNYRIVTSEPLNNLGYASGNPVGYSRVEVIEGQAGSNIGKTVYEFTDFRDIQANQNVVEFPYAPVEKADWGLGLSKSVWVYDNAGKLKKKTINTYNIVQENVTNDSIVSVQLGISGTTSSNADMYAYQWYYPVTGRSELIKTEDSTFYDDGSKLAETTQYTYSADHYNVKTIVKDLDRQSGQKIEKRLYYSDDYSLSSGAVKALKDKGITKLISTEEWITGDANPRITGGQITDFQVFNGIIIRPYKNYAFNSTAPVASTVIGNFNLAILNRKTDLFKENMTYAQYDNKGFLLQTIGEGGQTAAILPGPDKQYPIAKALNAGIGEIAYTSFESTEKGSWNYTGAPVLNNTAVTGRFVYDLSKGTVTRASLATTTNFTITFWAKNGTPNVTGASLVKSEMNSNTGWTCYEYKVSNQSTVTIGGTGVLDELRLYPSTSQMVTYSYDPFIGITSECDANNKTAYYTYDNLNRLFLVRDHNKQVIRKMEYGNNTVLHINPVWDYTGAKRCLQDQYGNTGKLEVEQVNINMNSLTFGARQWTVAGTSISCRPVEVWQNTGNKRCVKQDDGNNTGEVEIEQKNVNSNTTNYGVTRWISGGIDRQFCPDLCIGKGIKLINGVCENGEKYYTLSFETSPGVWDCGYAYRFSDGSTSEEYHELSNGPCVE